MGDWGAFCESGPGGVRPRRRRRYLTAKPYLLLATRPLGPFPFLPDPRRASDRVLEQGVLRACAVVRPGDELGRDRRELGLRICGVMGEEAPDHFLPRFELLLAPFGVPF